MGGVMAQPDSRVLKTIEPGSGYEVITEDPDSGQAFATGLPRGWSHGTPIGIAIHRLGNPIPDPGAEHHVTSGGATGLGAMRYGMRSRTFSIHGIVDGEKYYEGIDIHEHAFHVLA